MPSVALLPARRRISAKRNPAEQSYKGNAEQNANAVDDNVLCRRAAVCNQCLVKFIACGKGNTEDAGKKCERKAT